jgi:flagellar hook protein FlgE
VFLEGTLTPTGDVADTAGIIQSGILGDSSQAAPAAGTTAILAAVPNTAATLATGVVRGTGLLTALGVYQYKVVFADRALGAQPDTASRESQTVSVTLAAGQNAVDLTNVPTNANYAFRRIYRTDAGGSTFKLVGEFASAAPEPLMDDTADAALGAALTVPEATLSGNYSYYVTFADTIGGPPNGTESRPAPVIGPLNVVNGRIQLDNIPTDSSGQFSVRRIYRNLATDNSQFRFVAEIPNNLAGESFTDSVSDTLIQGNSQIDLDGPRISTNTLLTSVLRRDGAVYNQAFQTGTLAFNGRKGGRLVSDPNNPPQLDITATTTVLDLINFMRDALGIQAPPGPDPLNPIPDDTPTGQNAGGLVTANGEIRFIGNNGVDNAIEVALSAFTLIPTGSTTPQTVTLPFSNIQAAKGQSAVADMIVFDSLGIPLNVRVTAVLESVTGTETTYRWFADSRDNDPTTGVGISVGTGLVTFDGEGKLIGVSNANVSIDRANVLGEAYGVQTDQPISGLSTPSPTVWQENPRWPRPDRTDFHPES